MTDAKYTVVIVTEDDAAVEQFDQLLTDHHEVRTVTSTDAERDSDSDGVFAGLEVTEDDDVVLLERRPPTHSRDPITVEFDRQESDCLAIAVDASETESDSGGVHVCCREHVTKPYTERTLRDTITRLRHRAQYDDKLAECANLAAKRGALETEVSAYELECDDEYIALCHRLEELRADLDELAAHFDAADFRAVFETPDFAGGPRVQQVCWLS